MFLARIMSMQLDSNKVITSFALEVYIRECGSLGCWTLAVPRYEPESLIMRWGQVVDVEPHVTLKIGWLNSQFLPRTKESMIPKENRPRDQLKKVAAQKKPSCRSNITGVSGVLSVHVDSKFVFGRETTLVG